MELFKKYILPTMVLGSMSTGALSEPLNFVDFNQEGDIQFKSIAIPVNFQDAVDPMDAADKQAIDDALNKPGYSGPNGNLLGSVYDYFQDMSHGKLHVTHEVVDPITVSIASGNSNTKMTCGDNTQRDPLYCALEEALATAIQKDPNLFDGMSVVEKDGKVELVSYLFITSDNVGQDFGGSTRHYQDDMSAGITAAGAVSASQISDSNGVVSVNTVTHELGHSIFEWPDIYATCAIYDAEERKCKETHGMSRHALMSSGSINGNPSPITPYFRATKKIFNGTIIEIDPSYSKTYKLNYNSGKAFKIYNPDNIKEFLSISAVNSTTNDFFSTGLGTGLAIWHHTEKSWTQGRPSSEIYPSKDPFSAIHYIEQADGLYELDQLRNNSGADAGDIFSEGDEFPVPSSFRDMTWWDSTAYNFTIGNIQLKNEYILFDITPKQESHISAKSYNSDSSIGPFIHSPECDDQPDCYDYLENTSTLWNASENADGRLKYTFIANAESVNFSAVVDFNNNGNDSFFYRLSNEESWHTQNNAQTNGFARLDIHTWNNLTPKQEYVLEIQRREDGSKLSGLTLNGASFLQESPIVMAADFQNPNSNTNFEIQPDHITYPNNGQNRINTSDFDKYISYSFITDDEGIVSLTAFADLPNESDDSFHYQISNVDQNFRKINNHSTNGFSPITLYNAIQLSPNSRYQLRIVEREDGAKISAFLISGGKFIASEPYQKDNPVTSHVNGPKRIINYWKQHTAINNQAGLDATTYESGWWSARWTLEYAGKGLYSIRNSWKGTYLQINNDTLELAAEPIGGNAALWKLVPGWITSGLGRNYRLQHSSDDTKFLHFEGEVFQYGEAEEDWHSSYWLINDFD
ncbi:hypothetical protein [Marinagarivorans cellulosilyticus]|uniref:Uncharacterized protein n=1 Tax=Marinagarivorans cellulosilyticus TaxID=2721545 RepID=A0AAN1WE57_9GAMM|nr:hypothetical protein [Marinagarivorans cellulosilyticus]BCD95939.1 hypothetical protein MARGE09_P0138 [Marinagarivorans cellulosilyticus]